MKTVQATRAFGGRLEVLDHESTVCGATMRYAVFTPEEADRGPVPCLWYLSGLTCTWANVMEKGGILRAAAEHGLVVVAPDTSPRGDHVADDDAYDLGQGAGFYLTATEDPWAKNYRMDRYVSEELQEIVSSELPVDKDRQGILGHSMGGHGALTLHLKNQGLYKSCSAFAPISAPSMVPWGKKAFAAYLGDREEDWRAHDASVLVRDNPSKASILIDQGLADPFYEEQLRHDVFEAAAEASGQAVTVRRHEGYDHSYYFVSSFMDEHVRHHAEALRP